jgi:acyl-homoserine-lactone acylase
LKLIRLFVALMAMSMVFGLAANTASAKPSIAKQAKKKCKKKSGKAKKKCVKKTKKRLKAKRERHRIKNVPGATIRTTEYGIPRIVADNWKGLGFGYGYALAKENICSMADIYTTIRGERSRYFGPDEEWQLTGNGFVYTNLEADFAHKRIIEEKTVEKLLKLKAPQGPRPQVRQVVAGYVKGYNRWLKQTGVGKIQDETCRGKPWVKPITKLDTYRRFYELGTLASAGAAVDGTVNVSPPAQMSSAGGSDADDVPSAEDFKALNDKNPDIGSNAVSLGSQATSTGKGMLFGNPHFPWSGSERFFQAQLTIPGKMNVSGASLLGAPVVLIGHTRKLAWSHTVSTSRRFMIYREELAPNDPTSYMVNGQPVKMDSVDVTVAVRQPDGSVRNETRTLYSTKHGPITDTLQGQKLFGWTNQYAYSLRDPNSDGLRFINHFFDADRAQSVNDMVKALKRNQGVPWVNTIAADSKGNALYSDISVTPDVTPERLAECNTPGLGDVAWSSAKVAVFDGSRPACDPQKQPGAIVKGILSPSQMPLQIRKDYGSNMNDSYWVSNPKAPLEGFAPIIGGDRTARSLRTRGGLVQIEQQLANGGKFTLPRVTRFIHNNRNYSAELLVPDMVAHCQANPVINGVNVAEACGILAAWDKTENLDSVGAPLWREVMNEMPSADRYTVPFDVNDPVHTPRGLNVANPEIAGALADAVTYMTERNVPLNSTWRTNQYVVKNGQKIPIPGGPGGHGVFNVISAIENRTAPGPEGEGTGIYGDIRHGSSFIQAASLTGAKCPPVKTILTYSQAATNEKSKHFADQTRLFSKGKWVNDRFCPKQQKRSPGLKVKRLNGGAVATRRGW